MDGNPTLKQFLETQAGLGCESDGSSSYIRWRHIFWEHLVNRHRAVAKDLTPLRTFEYGARLQGRLDDGPLTMAEHSAVAQLARTLAAGDDYWQRTVLDALGLDLSQELGMTPFRRAVLVHVFRHGYFPIEEPWYRTKNDVGFQLAAEGYLDTSSKPLQLTDEGLAAAGVLWPRSVEVLPGKTFASGSDAYGVIVGAFDEDGAQTVVRLLEVEA
ncbi:hypothetical protein [Kocuria arenosa]|uniref:hypothetical protein n=1 Tax=Kocuria arenosa TaxID=3071446 RepID=UPI0034D5EAC7